MDCIRYLNAKAEFLMKRASEYKEEASILFACNDIRYVHKLLLIERIVDNDCIENVSFKKSNVKRPNILMSRTMPYQMYNVNG